MNTEIAFEEELQDHHYAPTDTEIAEAISDALKEISEEGLNGCKSFSELNDHIDANELAGFCDNRFSWTIEAINTVQGAVDKILRERPSSEVK